MLLANPIVREEVEHLISMLDEEDFPIIFALLSRRGCEIQDQQNPENGHTCKQCFLGYRSCRTLMGFAERYISDRYISDKEE